MNRHTTIKEYHEAVNFIENIPRLIEYQNVTFAQPANGFYIKRCKKLLELLGSPEKNLKIIHIAGTSGKGSTAAMIHQILTESGKKSGIFTSPHVTSTLERIQIGNRYLSPKTFQKLVNTIQPSLKKIEKLFPEKKIHFKEAIFVIALLAFKKARCEYAVIEAGMGGTFDYTNACSSIIQVITNIGFDHTKQLGKTLKKIAKNKVGIVKEPGILFTTEKRKHLLDIIRKQCKKFHTIFRPLLLPQQIMQESFNRPNKVIYKNEEYTLNMHGPAQRENAIIAIEVAKYLGLSEQAIRIGLQKAQLPARLEKISSNPLVIIDGAHNQDKITNLSKILKITKAKKKYLIFALSCTKSPQKILANLIPDIDHAIFTVFENSFHTCYSPNTLLQFAKKYKKRTSVHEINIFPHQALQKILKKLKPQDLLIITGSFYLVGELRKHWIPETYILKYGKTFKQKL